MYNRDFRQGITGERAALTFANRLSLDVTPVAKNATFSAGS